MVDKGESLISRGWLGEAGSVRESWWLVRQDGSLWDLSVTQVFPQGDHQLAR